MATREEIVKQNLEFVYGKRTHDVLDDPDKVSYRPTKAKYVDPDAITNFAGEYEFLAPTFPCKVYLPEDPTPYQSFEHALLASKFKNDDKRQEVRALTHIKDVKRLVSKEKGKNSVLYADWTERCISIAEMLLLDKFIRNRKLKEQLMKTGRRALIFRNDFGDLFWGVDDQLKGQNQLGKLLEKVRTVIDQGDDLETWVRHQVRLIEPEKVSLEVIVTKDGDKISEDCQTFELKSKFLIGKSEDMCDIVAAHPTVSRVHAIIVVERAQGKVQIVDLGSANGTKLDGVALAPYEIVTVNPLSVLTFGASSRQYRFVVDTQADERRKAALLQKIAQDQTATTYGGASNEETQINTVFVGNISFDATETDIRAFFAPCGAVVQINVPKDRASGAHKGIAFVTFADFKGVMQALARDGDELCGRNVKVKKSDAKKPVTAGKTADSERRPLRDHRNASERGDSHAHRDDARHNSENKYGLQNRDREDRNDPPRRRSEDRGRGRSPVPDVRSGRSPARHGRDQGRDDRRDRGRDADRNRAPRREDSRDRHATHRPERERERSPRRRDDSRRRDRDSPRERRRSPSHSPNPPRKRTREENHHKGHRREKSPSPSPPRRNTANGADSQRRGHQAASRSPSPPHRQRVASPSPPRRTSMETASPPRRARQSSPVAVRPGAGAESRSPSPPRRKRAPSPSVSRSASSSPPRRRRSPSPSPMRGPKHAARVDSVSPSRTQRREESPSPPRRPRAPSASASPSPPRRSRFN